MSDQFDRATEHEEQHRAAALKAQRARSGLTDKTWMDSARECRVCDDPIPMKRRKAVPGVTTCIDCQADLEHALRGTARARL